eukprot:6853959-Pyramimonas_sp.AAC.1
MTTTRTVVLMCPTAECGPVMRVPAQTCLRQNLQRSGPRASRRVVTSRSVAHPSDWLLLRGNFRVYIDSRVDRLPLLATMLSAIRIWSALKGRAVKP